MSVTTPTSQPADDENLSSPPTKRAGIVTADNILNADNPLLQVPDPQAPRRGSLSSSQYDAANLPNSANPLLTGVPTSCNQNPLTAPRRGHPRHERRGSSEQRRGSQSSHSSHNHSRRSSRSTSHSGQSARSLSPRAVDKDRQSFSQQGDGSGTTTTGLSVPSVVPSVVPSIRPGGLLEGSDTDGPGRILSRTPARSMKQRCRVNCMTHVANGHVAVAGSGDTLIFIVDGEGMLVNTLKGPNEAVTCMLHTQGQLWVAAEDRRIYVYDETWTQLGTILLDKVAHSLAPCPSGVAVQRQHPKVHCYSIFDRKNIGCMLCEELAVAVTFAQKHLWVLHSKGVSQWHPTTLANVQTQTWRNGLAAAVALAVTPEHLLVGTRHGVVYLMTAEGTVLDTKRTQGGSPILSMYYTGARLNLCFVGSRDGDVTVLEIKSRAAAKAPALVKQEVLHGHEKAVTVVAPRGDEVWTSSQDKLVLAWKLDDYPVASKADTRPLYEPLEQPGSVEACCTIL